MGFFIMIMQLQQETKGRKNKVFHKEKIRSIVENVESRVETLGQLWIS